MKMTVAAAESCIGSLALLKFFPSDDGARTALIRMLMEMCGSTEQAAWLGERMIELHTEWPGPRELRCVYCSRFPPKDGKDVASTANYPEGIPSATPVATLPVGDPVDPWAKGIIQETARKVKSLEGPSGQAK